MKTTFFGSSVQNRVAANQAPWVAYLVFSVFAVIGIAFFFLGIHIWNKAEASRAWPSVEGTVISSEVATHHSRSSSSSGSHTTTTYGAEIVYQYSYQGQDHRSNKIGMMSSSSSDYSLAYQTVRRYAPGTLVRVFVNVQDPSEAVLTPGAGLGEILFVGLGFIFAIIGIGGIVMMLLSKPADGQSAGMPETGDRLSQI